MAGPLNGVGQQVPVSQTFQPGGSEQTRVIRQQEQEQRKDEVQVRGASLSQSQGPEKSTEERSSRLSESSFRSANNNQESTDQRRGSLVNLVV